MVPFAIHNPHKVSTKCAMTVSLELLDDLHDFGPGTSSPVAEADGGTTRDFALCPLWVLMESQGVPEVFELLLDWSHRLDGDACATSSNSKVPNRC
jgi:hypothetical protein